MVEQVMEIYMSVNIKSSGNLVKEIKSQAQKAARVTYKPTVSLVMIHVLE